MAQIEVDTLDRQVQDNLANWQSGDNPLAPLNENEMDIIYEIGDLIKNQLKPDEPIDDKVEELHKIPKINTNRTYIKWMVSTENDVKFENLRKYQIYYESLTKQVDNYQQLFKYVNDTNELLKELKQKYLEVTSKTNSLHNLSEQLLTHQKLLKDNKNSINEKLHYFLIFNKTRETIDRLSPHKINSQDYIDTLITIDTAIQYLNHHLNFKESRIFKMKYESLLVNALNNIYKFVSDVITETTKQIIDPESKAHLVPLDSKESSFSLYYGKFQSASTKVKIITAYLEEKSKLNEQYKNAINDCRITYITQRLPILSAAVSKALSDLKDKYKNDYSVLFRSCGFFTMKICQDEGKCYNYFFDKHSIEFEDYLGVLCQHLYDILRPSLITINHVEILTELCGILRKEMLHEKNFQHDYLIKYEEIIKQLLQDVEERLVFRTNVFFQHDLMQYKPSPGDLAYPEKLKQLENIADELQEFRTDSRSSIVSVESQEVASINLPQVSQFRSYTGNSAADLHGMWYPTVKRTLVILSRLYFCLDRETFQGLAQEALLVCVNTISHASDLISARKSKIDGLLFKIKHLLIIREQTTPFQVDFTIKEMSLDFSTVQKAAVELIHKRNKLFTFSSSNALLEFLLEGTPKVKKYLVDSRKEVDKQLKQSCEFFISLVTNMLTNNIQQWIIKVDKLLRNKNVQQEINLKQEEFAKPKAVADIFSECLRNMKIKIPEIQKSMQLYLANRETEFILFRPIKNNVINTFLQIEQLISSNYTEDEAILIACPSPEQINVLICSVSLTTDQEYNLSKPN